MKLSFNGQIAFGIIYNLKIESIIYVYDKKVLIYTLFLCISYEEGGWRGEEQFSKKAMQVSLKHKKNNWIKNSQIGVQ